MRRGVPPCAVRVTGGPPIHEQGTDSAFVNGATVRMRHYIGVHTIDSGGIDMAARRAARGGATALQIFTAIPKYYGDKSSIRPERVARFRAALAETGIAPAQVLVHAAYVLNTATSDETKWSRAAAGLRKELERSTALGVGAFCFHPGAATDGDRASAVGRVARAITGALESVPGALRARTGYGLDTCHLFSAGHDLTASADAFKRILDDFESAAGEPPSFFHLNDSEGALGSNKDRHMLIGEGKIGRKPFEWLLQDRRSLGVPLILETPQEHPAIADDDPTPDPWDV